MAGGRQFRTIGPLRSQGAALFSLRTIIGLTFVAIMLVASLVRGMAVGLETQRAMGAEIGTSLSAIAEGLAGRLYADMQARAAMVQVLAQTEGLLAPGQAQRIVDEMGRNDPAIAWAGICDADGQVIAGLRGILTGQSLAQRPVYREGRQGLFLGDVHEAVLLAALLPNPTGEPLRFVDVAAPLHDGAGRLTGVLAVHYDWTWARRLLNDPQSPLRAREGVEAVLVAADGTVLVGPPALMGRHLRLSSLTQAHQGKAGWTLEPWPDGQDHVTGYAGAVADHHARALGWTVLVRQPQRIVQAEADRMRDIILWSGLALSFVFGTLGWWAAHLVTGPLRAIAQAADAVRLRVPGAVIPAVGGATEIRTLSHALRAMMTSLTSSNRALVATYAALERMETMAYQDRLTSLPNRRFFEQYMDMALDRAQQAQSGIAILYLDLDGFKPVNDQLGHEAGDEVLRQVGLRLAASLRQNDVVARIGGDEFACILVVSEADRVQGLPRQVADRLIAAVNIPMEIQGQPVTIGCSIGAATWPQDGADLTDVMRRADTALYQAKRQGKNRVAFHGDGEDRVSSCP